MDYGVYDIVALIILTEAWILIDGIVVRMETSLKTGNNTIVRSTIVRSRECSRASDLWMEREELGIAETQNECCITNQRIHIEF